VPSYRHGLGFVLRYNQRATIFNRVVVSKCNERILALDHCFQKLDPAWALHADGFHPSKRGRSVIASHIRDYIAGLLWSAPGETTFYNTEHHEDPYVEHAHKKAERGRAEQRTPGRQKRSHAPKRRSPTPNKRQRTRSASNTAWAEFFDILADTSDIPPEITAPKPKAKKPNKAQPGTGPLTRSQAPKRQ
jgi:hypothetical protein